MSIYMKIDTIEGNVTNAGFEGHMRVNSVEFGASRQDPNTHGGQSDRQRHSLNLSAVKVTKNVDTTSVLSLSSVASNSLLEIEINFTRSYGDTTGKYMTLKLKDCAITSVNISGEEGADPVETLLISYRENECIANDFNSTGTRSTGAVSQVLSMPRGQ